MNDDVAEAAERLLQALRAREVGAAAGVAPQTAPAARSVAPAGDVTTGPVGALAEEADLEAQAEDAEPPPVAARLPPSGDDEVAAAQAELAERMRSLNDAWLRRLGHEPPDHALADAE